MRKIIIRFRNQEDLSVFSKRINIALTKDTKEIILPTLKIKNKKNCVSKNTQEEWREHWKDMPEFYQPKKEAYAKIDVYMNDNQEEYFSNATEQTITDKTKSIWYPKINRGQNRYKRVVGGKNGKYPIYVVSKGRWEKCYTSNYLTLMEVQHYVVVEPQEADKYINALGKEKILILDIKYKEKYDTFDTLGESKNKGVGGARNFCWEHSIKNGHKWHWVMDDNIDGFHRLNRNIKFKVRTGAIFKATEDFVERYDNIAIAGLNYSKFCKECDKVPPYILNTRIYSCLLIRNDLPYRWRGRYNEDTDLSLRALKDGWCTIQLNAFLADKLTTQRIKGGNTEEFYKAEGTLPKSKMLEDMHPDVAKTVWKFNRWHHYVDYSPFKNNALIKIKNTYDKNNEMGMYYVKIKEDEEGIDNKTYIENKYKENMFSKEEIYRVDI